MSDLLKQSHKIAKPGASTGTDAAFAARRSAIKTLALGAAASVMVPMLQGCGGASAAPLASSAIVASSQSRFAYIGTYTPDGTGIYSYGFNQDTGALAPLKNFPAIANTSWLTVDPSGAFLYAVSEVTNFAGTSNGSVSAFAIDPASGDLSLINTVNSQGGAPVYLALHPSGKYALVANYTGANVAVFPILATGGLGDALAVAALAGPLGPVVPVDAPPGSFVSSGHDASHAHMIRTDPSGNFVYVSDLGTDRIFCYQFNVATGALTPNSPAFVSVSAGAGPRHFVFHPNGKTCYCITEEASTLIAFGFNSASGQLTQQQSVSTLPKGFVGTSYGSELALSADGNFLYAANRLHDSIAVFAVAASGNLSWVADAWTNGSYPRHIAIDASGMFLYACNQRSDAVTVFQLDRASGLPRFTGQYTAVGTPAVIAFV